VQTKTLPDAVTHQEAVPVNTHRFFPYAMILLMGCAIFLLDATLPLRGLWFYDALLRTNFDPWLLYPTHLLFPGKPTALFQPGVRAIQAGPLSIAWRETGMLFASFALLFLFYLVGLRRLTRTVSIRYVLLSTLLIGLLFTIIPVVTSQDIFSYIGYMRLEVFYHLNPLTALPIALQNDPIQARIYWLHQPSAYGPTWFFITGALQEIALLFGFRQVHIMVILLRVISVGIHVGSTFLIWSISGKLARLSPSASLITPRRRLYATLAFAWNPFLLLEAGLNAHNDITILFLVLLAIWFLVSYPGTLRSYALASVMLAAAASMKITLGMLLPGLLLYLWAQKSRRWLALFITIAAYLGTMILFYAPFWQDGQVLHFLLINPGSSHEQNTFYEFLIRLYASLTGTYIASTAQLAGSHIENVLHAFSLALFVIAYAALFLQALLPGRGVKTIPDMIRWMVLAWLAYIVIGSPWFWPWYAITLFGLYALLEAISTNKRPFLGFLDLPLAVRMSAFSMLTLYCWLSIAPVKTIVPHLTNFQWAYVRGLWIWIPPLLAVRFVLLWKKVQPKKSKATEQAVQPVQSTQ
jgi:hypothetical protein